MRAAALLALSAALAACSPAENAADEKIRGDARLVVFRECMALAASSPCQADDDVADIVKACGEQSYYLTIYLKARQ